MPRRHPLLSATCVFILMLSGGCGKKDGLNRVEVSGTVSVNGSPLEQGRIAFLPLDGTPGPSTGGEIQQGKFVIPEDQGPVIGKHRVEILATRPTGEKIKEGSGSDNPDGLVEEIEQFIPEKYNRKSTLTADLTQDSASSLSFDLEIPDP